MASSLDLNWCFIFWTLHEASFYLLLGQPIVRRTKRDVSFRKGRASRGSRYHCGDLESDAKTPNVESHDIRGTCGLLWGAWILKWGDSRQKCRLSGRSDSFILTLHSSYCGDVDLQAHTPIAQLSTTLLKDLRSGIVIVTVWRMVNSLQLSFQSGTVITSTGASEVRGSYWYGHVCLRWCIEYAQFAVSLEFLKIPSPLIGL